MTKQIGVMGCGWLGEPLAHALLEDGHTLRGSSTREAKLPLLTRSGILPYRIHLKESGFEGPIDDFLSDLDVLIFNVPPGLRGNPDANYPARIRQLDKALKLHKCPRLVYVSSTSVYGRLQGEVDERVRPVPDTQSGKQLLDAEDLLLNASDSRSILIIRFGGLIGPGRHPVSQLSGRKELSGGNDPVNLINRADCIRLLRDAVSEPGWTGLLNAVYPKHPPKAVYYSAEAEKRGLEAPEYRDEPANPAAKIIRSRSPKMKIDQCLADIFS